jgi:hypothetical protein
LVQQRQLELAEYNRGQQADQARLADESEQLKQTLGDPSGRIAAALRGSGVSKIRNLDLSTIQPAIDAANARTVAQKSNEENASNFNKLGYEANMSPILAERAGNEAEQRGLGTERATAASFPAALNRDKQTGEQATNISLDKTKRETPLLVSRAGQTSHATAMGGLQPDVVSAEVNKEKQMQAARTSATPPTEGEANKASIWTTMVVSDQKASKLEKDPRFKGLGPGLMASMQSPTVATIGEWLGAFNDPTEREYAQNAIDFASSLLYLRSGAQATAQEYSRFAFNNFALSTDSPEQKAQKSARRKVLAQANQVGMNKGKYQGGVAIGRAINAGQIGSLDFEMDGDVLRGVNDVLSGKVR